MNIAERIVLWFALNENGEPSEARELLADAELEIERLRARVAELDSWITKKKLDLNIVVAERDEAREAARAIAYEFEWDWAFKRWPWLKEVGGE